MNKNLLLLSVVICIECASAAESSDRVGNKPLPAGAVLICDEHVIGEASGKAVHIDWQAFGLSEDASETVQFYQSKFGQAPAAHSDGQSYTWTFKGEYNELQYSVKTPSAGGPWSGCAKQPTDFKAVVLISNAIWGLVFEAMIRASGYVPQISLVVGFAAGGAAYGPALTDVIVIDRKSVV